MMMMMMMARPHGDEFLVVVVLFCRDCSEAHFALFSPLGKEM
jgi:hypothetical protein